MTSYLPLIVYNDTKRDHDPNLDISCYSNMQTIYEPADSPSSSIDGCKLTVFNLTNGCNDRNKPFTAVSALCLLMNQFFYKKLATL